MNRALSDLVHARRGHFTLESGYHSEWWYELDSLFSDSHAEPLRPFVDELARKLARHHVEVVCGPKRGGAKLADAIAQKLALPAVHAERSEPTGSAGLFPVRYTIPAESRPVVRAKNVALVDDAISAGSALRGTFADLTAAGARPVALGALFLFSEAAAEFAAAHRLPLETCERMPFALWLPTACPLCQARIPLEKISDTT